MFELLTILGSFYSTRTYVFVPVKVSSLRCGSSSVRVGYVKCNPVCVQSASRPDAYGSAMNETSRENREPKTEKRQCHFSPPLEPTRVPSTTEP